MLNIVIVTAYFCRYRNNLNEERHRNRCGYLYEDLNVETGSVWALAYPILYQLRFLLIVFLSLNVECMILQILLFLVISFFICAVLGAIHPFKVLHQNYKSLVTEAIIIFVMDLFLIVSDPNLAGKHKANVGLTIVIIVALCLIIFITSLLYTSISILIRYIRRYFAHREAK